MRKKWGSYSIYFQQGSWR